MPTLATASAFAPSKGIVNEVSGDDVNMFVRSGSQVVFEAGSSLFIGSDEFEGGELSAIGGITAGVVTASKAVIVDANKDIGDFRNLDGVNFDAGASGTAGSVDVFPGTAAKGKLSITAADSAGDTTTTIINASQSGARIYTIPDAGGSASFVMTAGAQSLTGNVTLASGADLIFSGTTGQNEITIADNLADALSIKITGGADFLVFDSTDTNEKLTILSAATQKLGFFGATPVVQGSAYTQTYSTADKTHANPTQQAVTMVANVSGATENYQIQDSSANVTQAEYRVFAKTCALLFEQIRADLIDVKGLANSVIDDLQAFGLVA